MDPPTLAMCNFIPETDLLAEFAHEHGFAGVEWSFTPENLPENQAGFKALEREMAPLAPLEVRYHAGPAQTGPRARRPG